MTADVNSLLTPLWWNAENGIVRRINAEKIASRSHEYEKATQKIIG
jgi:hypothetical protein